MTDSEGAVAEAAPWVVDASMGVRDGMFCLCPAELDGDGFITSITYGLTYLTDTAPAHARLVAVVHEGGNEAVEAFCEEHADALARLRGDTP